MKILHEVGMTIMWKIRQQAVVMWILCLADTTETILQHIGLIRLDGVRVEDGFRYIAPEVLMLITSIAVYVGCTKLSAESAHSRASSASAPSTAAILPPVSSTVAYRNRRTAFFITVGKWHCVFVQAAVQIYPRNVDRFSLKHCSFMLQEQKTKEVCVLVYVCTWFECQPDYCLS